MTYLSEISLHIIFHDVEKMRFSILAQGSSKKLEVPVLNRLIWSLTFFEKSYYVAIGIKLIEILRIWIWLEIFCGFNWIITSFYEIRQLKNHLWNNIINYEKDNIYFFNIVQFLMQQLKFFVSKVDRPFFNNVASKYPKNYHHHFW